MNTYKYIHIMIMESNYNISIIELINNNSQFISEDHLFVIQHRSTYDECKRYKNVILDESILNKDMKRYINYSNSCDYIFLHSHSLSIRNMLKLNKKDMNKIVWCVWGHDLYRVKSKSIKDIEGITNKAFILFNNELLKISELIWRYKTKQMYAIGIGFNYDAIEIRRKFRDIRILSIPYGYKKDNLAIVNDNSEEIHRNKDNSYKIMVGHSGFRFLNHIEIINKLSRFKHENIIISLVLSYGDPDYIIEVENNAKKILGDRVEIIKNDMSYEEYISYLNNVDSCILDYKHQAALGNIEILLYLKKKLFLNKYGIIKTALLLEGIKTCNVSDINDMSFEELIEPLRTSNIGFNYSKKILDEKTHVDMWLNTLEELD